MLHVRRMPGRFRLGLTLVLASAVASLALVVAPITAPSAYANVPIQYCNPSTDYACFMVTARAGLNVRTGPSSGYPVVMTLRYGTWVQVCQVLGQNVGGNSIWDFVGMANSAFVSDYWMSTPTFGTTIRYACP
jgi:uncharacterized protein YraI